MKRVLSFPFGFRGDARDKVGDPRTHHDRIDFVYFMGMGLEVKEVMIVGENEENADIVVTPYPSDHRAVVASFRISK